jgi:uncharacterized protein (DUF427 family)
MGRVEPLGPVAPGEGVTAGLENVWDYPRPPRVERVHRRVAVELWGRLVAETTEGFRVLETSHPPTYYIPAADIAQGLLVPSRRRSVCEFKGAATYWDLVMGRQRVPAIAWSYADPWPGYERLADCLAFYPGKCSRCLVGEEIVQSQPGDFYGGWITANLRGPFKGAPGTRHW